MCPGKHNELTKNKGKSNFYANKNKLNHSNSKNKVYKFATKANGKHKTANTSSIVWVSTCQVFFVCFPNK